MDFVQILTEQTPAVALAIIVLWFYNRMAHDFLRERKEMIEALRAERKEWLEDERQRNAQMLEAYRAAIAAIAEVRTELQALRRKILDFVLDERRTRRHDE